jgi:hypothetical protein
LFKALTSWVNSFSPQQASFSLIGFATTPPLILFKVHQSFALILVLSWHCLEQIIKGEDFLTM